MKLTTYGMWEIARQHLLNRLLADEHLACTKEQINAALLEPVISTMINTSYTYQQQLQAEKSPLSLKERMLSAYEVSLKTMCPTLAQALGKEETLLSTAVNEFIIDAMAQAHQNIDYLLTLATTSRESKRAAVTELYGKTFPQTFEKLAEALPFHDPQLIERATKAVIFEINKNCPEEMQAMMKEHIKYMNEITAQKMADTSFAEQFKQMTGMSMEQYKRQQNPSTVTHFKAEKTIATTPENHPSPSMTN